MKITFAAIALTASALLVGGIATFAHAKSGASGSYTGCLAKGDEAGTFRLTNVGDAKAEYELVGGKDLAPHVGHKVEVTGTLVSGKEAAHAEGGKAESEAGHLRVKSMKHVAATCP